MTNPEDLKALAVQLRKDITAAQITLTELIRQVAELPSSPSTERVCPACGIQTRGPLSLAEHVHTSHGGPLPEHWARAEQLAGLDA